VTAEVRINFVFGSGKSFIEQKGNCFAKHEDSLEIANKTISRQVGDLRTVLRQEEPAEQEHGEGSPRTRMRTRTLGRELEHSNANSDTRTQTRTLELGHSNANTNTRTAFLLPSTIIYYKTYYLIGLIYLKST
jgi:hypothetical protein